jgi:hypothetical protein
MSNTKSIIEVLKAAAPEWTFEQINFVAGRHGAVVEDEFSSKLERISIQAGKRGKMLAAHAQHICKAHDTVIRSYHFGRKYMGHLGLTRRRQ